MMAGPGRKRVAILISGRGSNMAALIEATRPESFPAEIVLVISNRPDAAGLAHARAKGIPTVVVDHKAYGKDRDSFERTLSAELANSQIDLICLAGFMRLFTAEFVRQWEGRMLNIHPSLLPLFPGLDPHGQALRAGVRISGATVHFVTPETDAGPIIAQAAVPVLDDDTSDTLAGRVLEAEHRLYAQTLRLVAEGAVSLIDGRCRVSAGSRATDALFSPPL